MGTAGFAFIPPIQKHPTFEWVAFTEPTENVRTETTKEFGVTGYTSLAEMLAHPGLDAVYIATPTPLHSQQTIDAANAGKHVLVEKPMATSVADAKSMIDAAHRAGVVLLVGHGHSHDLPIKRMREIIESGELGPVGMVNTWCFTDWMQRPRRADELDVNLGGGVTFRQGTHQFDILRLLCGGMAQSVRASTFDWDPERNSVGAHSAFIEFENGVAATAVYNGYGGFSSMDLCGDISEWGFHQPRSMRSLNPAPNLSDQLAAKRARARKAIPANAPHQPHFGVTVVSCERGDIRQSANGLYIYDRTGMREISLPTDQSPRDLVINEFHDAIDGQRTPIHDGRWGLANLELCVAALKSSITRAEVRLKEQIAIT